MKKIYLLLVFLACTIGYSQTNGISYQALILNPNLKKMPGINEANTALANQKICLQFIIKDEQRQLEYQETVSTSTDELGMVNVIIGSGSQTGGYAIDFKSVIWNSSTKTLNVGVNISGSCGSFTEVSDQIFNSVPFAFSAGNVTGIVSIENGGTNASNVVDAKINLNLGNVDNTSDVLKPVSTATQTALNLKENLVNKSNDVNTDGSSDIKYPSVKAVKTYVDASATLGSTALGTEVSRALTAETANAAAISAESLARTNGDATNAALILAETSARTDGDAIQNTAIGANASAITAETSSRTDADAIQNTAIGANTSAITTETSARTDADAIQNTAIGANASAITAESLARTTGDAINAASILAETSSRTDADAIQNTAIGANASAITAETSARTTAISAESLARTNGDVTNAASILAETSSRTDADVIQNTAIGANASAITAETLARTNGDATNAASILAEKSARIDADASQNTAIGVNASAITAETSARTTADGVQNTAITDEAARAGLAEVANTTAIGSKEDAINKSIDGTFASNSDVLFPTEKATKTYVDAQVTTATTGNFVNLTTDQNVAGDKSFNNNLTVNGQTDLSMLRVNGFADIRDAIFTGSIFDVMSDARFSGMRFDVMGDAMFGGNINNGGNITSNSFIKNNGLSTQFLKADGSVDSATYLTSAGTATNVSGVVAIGNGGTGSSTVSGAKITLGLENVDNTSDANKPVSAATQSALDLKADLASPTFTGTVTAPKLVIGANTYPTIDGTVNQVLTTDGSGTLNWTSQVTLADLTALQNQIANLNNAVVNLQSQISQLQNSGSWSPTVISGTMSDIFANYFVVNDVVYVSGNFSNADFDGMGMYVDLNIPVSANFINASDVHGTVLGEMLFGESASGYVEAIPNSSTVRLNLAGAHMMAFGTNGSFVFSYKLPGATASSSYTPVVTLGTGNFSDTNYIVNGNIVLVNGNFTNANLDDYGSYIDINLPISTNFVNSSDASGIISGISMNESLSGYIEGLVGTNKVRLRASGAHRMGFDTSGSFVFSYKINSANNTSTYDPTVLSGTGNFSSANYITVGKVVYVSGNFSNADFDGMGLSVDISIPGSTIFNNASDVHGVVAGIAMGESASGYVEAIPNSSTVRLNVAGAHQMAFGTNGSFIFSYIKQ